MLYVIIIISSAVIGNLLLRRILKAIEGDDKPCPPYPFKNVTAISSESILHSWGKQAHGNENSFHLQSVHPDFVRIFQQYEHVAPDKYLRVIDRTLIAPLEGNDQFVQIGVWGDGSETLVKRDATDPRVYIADDEEGGVAQPSVMANSLENYLVQAWCYHVDSLKH